jgi:hypothetical protein
MGNRKQHKSQPETALIDHVMQPNIKRSLNMEKKVMDKISPSYPEF